MFSEELRILDHNTAEYMVDVMQDTIDSQQNEIASLKLQNDSQQGEIDVLKLQNDGQRERIDIQQETIDNQQEEIACLKAQLEALKK